MQELIQFFSTNWTMSLALLIVFIMILINEVQFLKKKGKEISPQGAVSLINHDNAIVIDIRDAESYQKGHIIDAVQVAPEKLLDDSKNKYKDKTIILVCNKGINAATLAVKLKAKGYKNPQVLSGGISAWQAAQLPIVKG